MPEFSTPALHAIEQTVELSATEESTSTHLPLHEAYEIDSTVSEILSNGYRTIALQFPDELLNQSVLMYRALMLGLKRGGAGEDVQCYVLGDSTYGSCCPDVLSCSHLPADFLVHYGHACLTPTEALPVRYVFPKRPLDVPSCSTSLFNAAFPAPSPGSKGKERATDQTEQEKEERNILVVWDVAYDWLSDDIDNEFAATAQKISHVDVHVTVSRINREAKHRPRTTSEMERTAIGGGEKPNSGVNGGCCSGSGQEAPGGCRGKSQSAMGGCCSSQVNPSRCGCSVTDSTETKASTPAAPPTTDSSILDPGTTTPSDAPPSLRSYPLPSGVRMKDCVIFYIGEESRGMVNLMMENGGNEIYQYHPSSNTVSPLHARTPLLLRRRYFTLHRALQSSVFGLLVHNVGLSSSHALLTRLRALLTKKRRKSYTISVGRLNPAKLGNFEVVECWVLIGCREGGLVDNKEYYRPIITPYELILALDGEKGVARWDPEQWTLDFGRVLSELEPEEVKQDKTADQPATETPPENVEEDQEETIDRDDEDQPVFSLVSGTYHSARLTPAAVASNSTAAAADEVKRIAAGEAVKDGALVVRDQERSLQTTGGKMVSVAGEHLANRSYQGLNPDEGYGGDGSGVYEPAVLEEGREGIARGYGEEERHR